MSHVGGTVELRDAAFGASPGTNVWPYLGAAEPRRHWLAAVVLGGQGHYAAAATALTALLAHADRTVASLAASTLASHRRQLGAHAAARPLDGLALRLAVSAHSQPSQTETSRDPDGGDRAGAVLDALVGLAADAVGLGRVPQARRLLAAAQRCGDAGPWRASVRLGWLAAEVELAAGRAEAAIEPARRAMAQAQRRGSVRHAAKSGLVLAAALATAGQPEPACRLLHDVTDLGRLHGLVPLIWPAELLLAEHCPPRGAVERARHVEQARAALTLVVRRADAPLRAAAARSPSVRSDLLRTGDSAERSSAGEIRGKYVIRTCQGSTPRDR